MDALRLAHAYLIGATIHTPQGNRSPTKDEVIRAILDALQTNDHQCPEGSRPNDAERNLG